MAKLLVEEVHVCASKSEKCHSVQMLNYRLGTVVKLSEGSEKGEGNCHLFFLLAESRIVLFFGRAGESLLLLSHPKFIFCFSLPLQYRYMKNNNSSVSLSWFYSCVC